MSELPPGWESRKIGDLASVRGGKRLPAGADYSDAPTPYPYVRVSDFDRGTVDTSKLKFLTKETHAAIARYAIGRDDVYISIAGSIGIVGRVPPSLDGANLTENAAKISPSSDLDPDYLVRVLSSPEMQSQIRESTIATTQPKLALFRIESLEIPVPPLDEQRRIVVKLEDLLSRSQRTKAVLDTITPLLEKLRQSILAAAFRGDLTAEWRKKNPDVEPADKLLARIRIERRKKWEEAELAKMKAKGKPPGDDGWKARYKEPPRVDGRGLPELPNGWCWASLPMLGELARGKSKHRPRNDPKLFGKLVPFIQTGDVARSGGRISEYTAMYSHFGVEQSRVFRSGTVCITIAASIAASGILTFDACFPDSVVGLVVDERTVSGAYVEYFVRTARDDLKRFAPATAQANINLDILEKVAVPIPPHREMLALLSSLETALDAADGLGRLIQTAAESNANVNAAVLRRAFMGDIMRSNSGESPRREATAFASPSSLVGNAWEGSNPLGLRKTTSRIGPG